ncbi:MAG: hypothetical protein COA79_25750 [Planctomycetota bacterium]|nr:MAG: hypothetical protein COA79_25750 [Planctomycetota bacterium]
MKNILLAILGFTFYLLSISLHAQDHPFGDPLTFGKKKYKSCSPGKHFKGNSLFPKRSATGRINAHKFIKQYGEKKLVLLDQGIVPENNFGTYSPGDNFGNSWIISAEGIKVGMNHKSGPWAQAVIECKDPDNPGKTINIKPVAGCGCGGTADWSWVIPFSAPPGTHKVIVTWEWPKKTKQKFRKEYTVTIVNKLYKQNTDPEITKLQKKYGKDKVLVFQNGLEINGKTYDGVDDMGLTYGGYEGDRTGIINPANQLVEMGYWIVNAKASYYARGLFRFNLEQVKGKKIKLALFKLSIKQNQPYLPAVLKQSFPIYAMKKTWKEGKPRMSWGKLSGKFFVDSRGLAKGHPNYAYQAWPTRWEKHLASGDSDRTEKISNLVIDPYQHITPGARADLTETVNAWTSGKLENNGILIGNDLPKSLNNIHPGKGGKTAEYKKLYSGGAVPFISSENGDKPFTPRLIIVLE